MEDQEQRMLFIDDFTRIRLALSIYKDEAQSNIHHAARQADVKEAQYWGEISQALTDTLRKLQGVTYGLVYVGTRAESPGDPRTEDEAS